MDTVQKWTLIISIIGAAAWLPPLLSLVKKWLTKPALIITPSNQCLVGFAELGPIINIKMAITADNESILIDRIEFELSHDSGAKQLFRWHEVAEVRGQMIVPGVSNQPVIQESEAIAIKILSTDFKDILLKNRLEEHSEGLRKYDDEFNKERRRLSNNNQYDPLSFYASKTVQDMQAFMQSQMIWKKGQYRVRFLVHTRSEVNLHVPELIFSLSGDDIVLMQANSDNLPRLLKNICLMGTPSADQVQSLDWHWLNKKLTNA